MNGPEGSMGEHVWEQRGVGRPLDGMFRTPHTRMPRRGFILAAASILVLILFKPAPMSSTVVFGSDATLGKTSSITLGPGLTLHVPVGLRVEACARCYVGPYLFRSYIPYPARFGTGNCVPPWLVGFASTAATPSMVRARLDSAFGGPAPGPLTTSQLRIGETTFTLFDYGFADCRPAIAIGAFNGVTYLIDVRMSTTDPTIRSILRSISFSN